MPWTTAARQASAAARRTRAGFGRVGKGPIGTFQSSTGRNLVRSPMKVGKVEKPSGRLKPSGSAGGRSQGMVKHRTGGHMALRSGGFNGKKRLVSTPMKATRAVEKPSASSMRNTSFGATSRGLV